MFFWRSGFKLLFKWKNFRKKIFDKFYVHPGSGDQGHAIGACYLGHLTKYPNFKFEKIIITIWDLVMTRHY